MTRQPSFFFFFFFNDTATTEIYTLSLHDALPIYVVAAAAFEPPDRSPQEICVSDPRPQLELVTLNGDARAWDEFVTRAEGSSFCHLSSWRQILSDTLGAECLYWAAADADRKSVV